MLIRDFIPILAFSIVITSVVMVPVVLLLKAVAALRALSTLSGHEHKQQGVVCPKCQKPAARPEARYCSQCGTKLQKTCHCGNLMAATDSYCSKCGRRHSGGPVRTQTQISHLHLQNA